MTTESKGYETGVVAERDQMEETFTLPKQSLITLLSSIFRQPAPSDQGDLSNLWGLYSPIAAPISSSSYWAMLNPQPLPPIANPWKRGPLPDPWEHEPFPQPWRFAVLTRTIIWNLVTEHQLAQTIAGSEQSSKATEVIGLRIRHIADWICGNEPIRIHIPLPWPWPPDEPRPIKPEEALAASVQFHLAARMLEKDPLQQYLAAAADRVLDAGVKGLSEKR